MASDKSYTLSFGFSVYYLFLCDFVIKYLDSYLFFGGGPVSGSKRDQFLVSLTSIVYFFPTMEVNETKNRLVTDIFLNIRKSAEWIRKW